MRRCKVYLLVLISCHCCKLRLRKGERVHALGWKRWNLGQVHAGVMLDHMDAWLVSVHGLQDDLCCVRE